MPEKQERIRTRMHRKINKRRRHGNTDFVNYHHCILLRKKL